ncbi:protein kinase, ATP binding site-containing protein [Tanacetum coccineum]
MSPPPEVNLENLGISREQIDNVATNFKTGAVIKPGVYRYEGHLYEPDREDDGEDDREVVMFLEVDLKSRWKSSKSGFVYSDEFKILSMCRHKNILPFIGYYDDKDAFFQDGVDGDKVIGDYKPQRLIDIVRRCYDNKPEQMIDSDLRDHIDRRSFQMFIDIAYRCISFDLKDRPTMDEVAKTLTEALDIHKRAPSPSGDLRPTKENIAKFSIPLEEMRRAMSKCQKIAGCGFYRTELFFDYGQKGPVALKRFNGDDNSFQAKLEIVSRLQHQNIIPFIGFGKIWDKFLVYECAYNGSLSTYLHSLTWAQRLKICIGAAKGLKYLHSGLGEYESVIHGEFTSQNILITEYLEAKICGLDSSFLVPRNHPDTKVYEKPVGKQQMDPVYRESYIPKVESDVYSLGVVLFEVLTGMLVNTKCDGDEELNLMALVRRHYGDGFDDYEFIDPDIRNEIDVRSLHICKEIAYRCISNQIKRRPSMNKIIRRLEEAMHIQNHLAAFPGTQRSMQYQKLEDFFIPLSHINFDIGVEDKKIGLGAGGFGNVYKGQLREPWQSGTVAIKCMQTDSNQKEYVFRNELNMIFRLSHENIIPFIGYCDEGKEKYIVYEYASEGSLDCHLEDEGKRCKLTWEHRLKICLGAATGLDYLHSDLGEDNRVIHRDVKSGNILLDHKYVAKVCDFGLSKSGPINQQDTQVYTNAAGTDYYVDPVYHESGVLRKESDVYSFGVVMFELLSGLLAYKSRKLEGDEPKPLLNIVRRYYASKPELLIDPLIRDNQVNDISPNISPVAPEDLAFVSSINSAFFADDLGRFCFVCSSLVVIGRGIVGEVVFGVVGVAVSVSVISGSLLVVVEKVGLDGLDDWIGVVFEVVWGTTSNGGAGSASGMFGKTVSKTKSGLFDVLVESKWN